MKEDNEVLTVRERLFSEEHMFNRIKKFAEDEGLEQSAEAVEYMRERHKGQYRKRSLFSDELVSYINHPLLMACQAIALGIKDDELISSILLHDVVEDTGVTSDELPFDSRIREIVSLVSFSVPSGETKKQAKEEYFERIAKDPQACVVKLLDRCNNVSTMAGSFTVEKIYEYIEETEEYILPLAEVIREKTPEYSDLAFLLKYHILSIIETIKCLLLRNEQI